MTLGVPEHLVGSDQVSYGTRRGFSLVDVLVTMAVIAVLISILAPSLASIRETARQVVCRSNVRQLGIGVTQFAADRSDRIPSSIYVPDSVTNTLFKPWETMTLRIDPGAIWDGLGRLYSDEYSPSPQVFYCPSHKGDHRYTVYEDVWAGGDGAIVGNFQYRGRAPIVDAPISQVTVLTDRLSGMRSGTTLLADGFRTQTDYNHQVGANVFRADSSVGWFADRGGTFATSFAQLPKDSASAPPTALPFEQLWSQFDRP